MSDEQAAIFCLAVAVIGSFALYGLRAWIRRIDRNRPRFDHVPVRHRRIAHNGFKSRMGAR